jgi:hypothetical protein
MHGFHTLLALAALTSILAACGSELRDEPARAPSLSEASSQGEADGPAVSAEGAVDVDVSVGADAAARIECDPELLPKVHVEQRGKVTRVYNDPGFSGRGDHGPCTVYLGLASLRRVEASGSGDVRVHGLAPELAAADASGSGDVTIDDMGAPALSLAASGSGNVTVSHAAPSELSVDAAGSGNVRVKGTAERARFALSGSGDVDARSLRAVSAEISVSGSGNVAVHASKKVVVSAVGSGDVKIAGQPAERSVSQVGSGSIDFE